MQKTNSLKVLIVTPHFAPDNGVAAVRPSKLAKQLCKNHNCIIDVIKLVKNSAMEDEKLKQDIKDVNNIYIMSRYDGSSNPISLSKNFIIRKFQSVILVLNRYIGQKKVYKRVLKEMQGHNFYQYDVVYTTFGPLSPHMLGKYIKKVNPNCIWVADYRDPSPVVVHSTSLLVKKIARSIIWSITKKADLITGATPICYEFLDKYKTKHCELITNGFDENDFGPRRNVPNKKLTVSYTGTIYEKKQDLQPFFKAITKLIDEFPEAKDNIELHYAGKQSDIFVQQAKQCSVDALVIDHKQISRTDSLNLQYNSDILLMSVWNDEGDCDITSGKVYEYMGSQIPVVCIVTGNKPDSMIKNIFKNTKIGCCYEMNFDSFELLYEYLKEQYINFSKNGFTEYKPNINEINKFRYESISDNLFSTVLNIKKGDDIL